MHRSGLFLIPARAGSKGIKDKNGATVCGKTLIDHAINVAEGSSFDWPICLSTDSSEWRSRYKRYAPFLRPTHLATDEATSLEVIYHAVKWYSERGTQFDFVCLLEPPGVLRQVDDIQRGFAIFEAHKFTKSVVSLCKVGDAHPIRMKKFNPDTMELDDYISEPVGLRRQDQPDLYLRNTFVYFLPVAAILNKRLYTKPTYGFVIDRLGASVNIDTIEDLILARAILEGEYL